MTSSSPILWFYKWEVWYPEMLNELLKINAVCCPSQSSRGPRTLPDIESGNEGYVRRKGWSMTSWHKHQRQNQCLSLCHWQTWEGWESSKQGTKEGTIFKFSLKIGKLGARLLEEAALMTFLIMIHSGMKRLPYSLTNQHFAQSPL